MKCRPIVRMALAAGVLLPLLSAGRAAAAADTAQDPKTWEFEGQGRWKAVAEPATTRPTDATGRPRPALVDNPTLDRVERAIARRDYQGARRMVLPWLRQNPAAPDRDRGLFLLAKAYYGRGDRVRAFYQLDELMDSFPESTLYGPALEMQFQIADDYLRGRKDKLFGLRILPRREEAVEMLFRIQERSPGSPQAERALLRTADFYYDTAQFDLAQDAYAIYAKNYPRSPNVANGRVPLRAAYSSLAQFRGLDFDATPLIDARAQLEDVQQRYPEIGRQQNVPQVIERIDAAMAAKMFRRADFFKRTEQPNAAAATYRSLMEQYPNSPEATRAEQALARLPQQKERRPRDVAPGPTDVGGGPNLVGPDAR